MLRPAVVVLVFIGPHSVRDDHNDPAKEPFIVATHGETVQEKYFGW
jgi:hypothetical protein